MIVLMSCAGHYLELENMFFFKWCVHMSASINPIILLANSQQTTGGWCLSVTHISISQPSHIKPHHPLSRQTSRGIDTGHFTYMQWGFSSGALWSFLAGAVAPAQVGEARSQEFGHAFRWMMGTRIWLTHKTCLYSLIPKTSRLQVYCTVYNNNILLLLSVVLLYCCTVGVDTITNLTAPNENIDENRYTMHSHPQ